MKKKMEVKVLDTFVQSVEDRVVKQIFAVMGNQDDGGDVIHLGAFTKTLAERFDDIQVLWQHEGYEPPVGVPIVLKEIGRTELPTELIARYPEAEGALFGAIEYLDTARGNEVLTGIQKRAIKKNSIGFATIKADFETVADQQIRHLRELMLYDVSPVNWGMNRATQNVKSAMPYRDCGIVSDQAAAWSAPTLADFTDAAWGDLDDAEINRIAAHFAWSGNNPPEAFGDLKLPHHQAGTDGVGKAVWKGCTSAMGALMGARGGVSIPDGDREAVYNHLAKHYAQFEKEPPAFKFVEACSQAATLAVLSGELKAGRMISAANLDQMQTACDQMQSALDILEEMIAAAQPPDTTNSGKGIALPILLARARMAEQALKLRAVAL